PGYVCSVDEAFIANVADAPAIGHPRRATVIDFEERRREWPDLGVNIQVMQPGQPNCRYHSETVQEDFLVLAGECKVILEGEERALRQWDFVHCPAGTEHVFVGAGDGPCAVLMIGSRQGGGVHYPVNELAAAYDASAKEATDSPAEAYADWNVEPRRQVPNPWADLTGRDGDS
ncbi:MAG TPA: cupin domain-containing protein, partial [Solirubrobacteraceae bacterium]|nr:cupin domain-containing protein [Solirubrobacteraceae bacterium]